LGRKVTIQEVQERLSGEFEERFSVVEK